MSWVDWLDDVLAFAGGDIDVIVGSTAASPISKHILPSKGTIYDETKVSEER